MSKTVSDFDIRISDFTSAGGPALSEVS